MTVYLKNKNKNEQIYKKNFEMIYKTNSYNIKHKQKENYNVVEYKYQIRVFNYKSWKID